MAESPYTRFSLLARIVEISNSNIQVENRLKHICDFLSRETRTDCVCIYRRDVRGEDLAPWVSSCLEIEECALMDFVVRPGEGVSGKAARKRAPVFFPDVKTNPPTFAIPRELRDFTSILSVPVMDDVYLYGVMNFSSPGSRKLRRRRTLRSSRSVATEVAGTIRNSRLYNDARKRVSELITLNEIGRAISSTFEVKETLGYVAKTTLRLLSAEGCTVRLAGEGRGVLKVVVDEGYSRPGFRRELRVRGEGAGPADPRRQAPAPDQRPRGFPVSIRRLPPSGSPPSSASPSFPRGSPSGRSATTPPPPGCASTWKGCT